jgi:hypothetical protein
VATDGSELVHLLIGYALGFISAYIIVEAARWLRRRRLEGQCALPIGESLDVEATIKHPVCISAVQTLLMERLSLDIGKMRGARSNLESAAFTSLVAIDVEACRQALVPRDMVDAAFTRTETR